MKKIILPIFLLSIISVGCNKKSEFISNVKYETQKNSESESTNGTYYYEDSSASLEIIITGSTWTGKTVFKSGVGDTYDNEKAEYQNGILKGTDLYDDSGYSKIGSINGNSLNTSIGGNTITLKK